MPGEAIDINRGRSMFSGQSAAKPKRERKLDIPRIMEEISDADTEKQNQLATWRDCFDLAMPNRAGFDGQAPGQTRIPQKAYDSHPIRALRRGTGNLIGALIPPEQQWADLVAGPEVPKERADKLNKGLESLTKIVFSFLGKCRFATKAHAMAMDLMCSTGFLAIDVGDQEFPFRISAVPLNECFPVEGPDGEIATVYRRYCCRISYIRRKWPAAKLSPRLAEMEQKTPRAKVEVIEGSIYEPGYGYRTVLIDPADRTAPMLDVLPTDPDEPSRWITPRLYVRPNDVYGCGPLVEALPSMRYLNQTQQDRMLGRQKRANPPLLMDTETGLNPHTIRLGSNYVGMIPAAALAGRPPFYELPSGSPESMEAYEIQDHRRIIDDILFATDVVPPVQESRQMTAFEVSVRRQQLLIQQGVDLGRVQNELPYAVMERCVWILGKLGLIPEIKLDGRMFELRYRGPLAQAQDAEKANAIFGFFSAARAAVGDEAVALGAKIEDAVAVAGEMWPGVPNSLLRDEQEREQMQKQAAQIAAQQAAAQNPPQMQQSALPGGQVPG